MRKTGRTGCLLLKKLGILGNLLGEHLSFFFKLHLFEIHVFLNFFCNFFHIFDYDEFKYLLREYPIDSRIRTYKKSESFKDICP